MSLKHGILGLLNYMPMTGYELNKAFNDSLGFFWSAQQSQIYRELSALESSALLQSTIEVQTGKPNRRVYEVTEKGKEELAQWLSSETPPHFLPAKNNILIRLFFSASRGKGENIKMLGEIITRYRDRADHLRTAADNIGDYAKLIDSRHDDALYWELAEDFGRLFDEMCIQWAENSIEKLEQLQGDPL